MKISTLARSCFSTISVIMVLKTGSSAENTTVDRELGVECRVHLITNGTPAASGVSVALYNLSTNLPFRLQVSTNLTDTFHLFITKEGKLLSRMPRIYNHNEVQEFVTVNIEPQGFREWLIPFAHVLEPHAEVSQIETNCLVQVDARIRRRPAKRLTVLETNVCLSLK